VEDIVKLIFNKGHCLPILVNDVLLSRLAILAGHSEISVWRVFSKRPHRRAFFKI